MCNVQSSRIYTTRPHSAIHSWIDCSMHRLPACGVWLCVWGTRLTIAVLCSLCRIVFQDISSRLPQVGSHHHVTVWSASVHPSYYYAFHWLTDCYCCYWCFIDHPRLKCLFISVSITNSLDSDMDGVAERGRKGIVIARMTLLPSKGIRHNMMDILKICSVKKKKIVQ